MEDSMQLGGQDGSLFGDGSDAAGLLAEEPQAVPPNVPSGTQMQSHPKSNEECDGADYERTQAHDSSDTEGAGAHIQAQVQEALSKFTQAISTAFQERASLMTEDEQQAVTLPAEKLIDEQQSKTLGKLDHLLRLIEFEEQTKQLITNVRQSLFGEEELEPETVATSIMGRSSSVAAS